MIGPGMLRIDIQSAPPTVTLMCRGRLVLGLEAETLRCVAMARQEQHVLLNLSRVGAIDAAGLGLLVELHWATQRRSATLVIANPSSRAQQMITLTRLDRVLQIAGALKNTGNDSQRCCTMTA